MAMNKRERAELLAAVARAELLAALRWTTPVERDVPPPSSESDNHSQGWFYNSYSMVVERAWSKSTMHGRGAGPKSGRIATQGPIWLYSTRERALAAMRNEIERESAKRLLQCDRLPPSDDESEAA